MSYLEDLQILREKGDPSAQQKIDDYFMPKKVRAERKRIKRRKMKRMLEEEGLLEE